MTHCLLTDCNDQTHLNVHYFAREVLIAEIPFLPFVLISFQKAQLNFVLFVCMYEYINCVSVIHPLAAKGQ